MTDRPLHPDDPSVKRHKFFLRNYFRRSVLSLPEGSREKAAQRLTKSLLKLESFRRAGAIGLYLSMPHEINTAPILRLCRSLGKTVLVPKIDPSKGTMRFITLPFGRSTLQRNVFGILEPTGEQVFRSVPNILLVPGRAFTPRGDRLGSGGGYYDRYLSLHPSLPTIGLGFREQICSRLPTLSHDRRVKFVLTPETLYRAKTR